METIVMNSPKNKYLTNDFGFYKMNLGNRTNHLKCSLLHKNSQHYCASNNIKLDQMHY